MKIADRTFAWILMLLGFTHLSVTFFVYKTLTIDAIWFFSGGLAMMFGAQLNLVRSHRPGDRLPAMMSVLANLGLMVFVAASLWVLRALLVRFPQVIVTALAIGALTLFSIRSWLQSSNA